MASEPKRVGQGGHPFKSPYREPVEKSFQKVATLPTSAAPMSDEALDLLREIREELRALRGLVVRGRPEQPSDRADADLLLAIVAACGDRLFTSRELLAHADVAPALRAALGTVGAK